MLLRPDRSDSGLPRLAYRLARPPIASPSVLCRRLPHATVLCHPLPLCVRPLTVGCGTFRTQWPLRSHGLVDTERLLSLLTFIFKATLIEPDLSTTPLPLVNIPYLPLTLSLPSSSSSSSLSHNMATVLGPTLPCPISVSQNLHGLPLLPFSFP